MKIVGHTVGTPLPKPDFKQTDPTKGDYIKNKPAVVDAAVGELLAIKTIDADGHISEFETVEVSTDDVLVDAKEYTDDKITDWVGDHTVPEQVSAALTTAESYIDTKIANLLNNSTEAVDSIYELRDAMEENADAIAALETIAGNKASASDLANLKTLVGDTPVATQIVNAVANYYTKDQIDTYEFITINDIDEICNGSIQPASEVKF